MNGYPPSSEPAVLQQLPSITLEELNTRAALQTRIDRKYLVPAHGLPLVLDTLADRVAVLEIDGARSTDYTSLYYDTDDNDCYLATAHGRRRRFKIRTRTYRAARAAGDLTYLEVKTRGPRGATVKSREERHRQGADRLDGDDLAFVTAVLSAQDVPGPVDTLWNRCLRTDYRRTTLFVPGSGSRVTIDLDLTWTGASGTVREAGRVAVVETKSGSSASIVDRLLWAQGHRPVTLSKFGTGMALLDPRLPAHRWRRVIDRHLTSIPTAQQ